MSATLQPLTELPANWDSFGGRPVEQGIVELAERLVTPLIVQDVPAPAFIPTSSGGLSLEWHGPRIQLVIQLPSKAEGESPTAFFADDDAGEEWEVDLGAMLPRVWAALARFIE